METLGWALAETEQFEEARNVLSSALKVTPESASTRYRLGLTLARIGELEAARDAFRQVLESGEGPESELARAELARLEAR